MGRTSLRRAVRALIGVIEVSALPVRFAGLVAEAALARAAGASETNALRALGDYEAEQIALDDALLGLSAHSRASAVAVVGL